VAGRGAAPSTPSPAPPGASAALLAQLDGRSGGNGGARTVPTDTTVANSGIAAAVSSTVGIQAQTQQPPRVANAVQQAQSQLQVTAQSQVVAGSISAAQAQTTTSPTPTRTPLPPPPAPPPPLPPVVISYAGLFKDTPGSGTATTQGFINQGPNNRIAYTGGTLTYPAGQPANSVFAARLGPGSIQFPLAPGSTSPGFVNFGPAGTASLFGPFT
jgi:hypothetical protein